jgi:transposase
MAKKLVTDELWEVIEPLLPEEPPKPNGGRPRIDDRAALTGILFVLKSGIPWKMLPQEMGCGSGMTCWQEYSGSTDCGTSSSWPEAPAISGQCCATSRRFPESSADCQPTRYLVHRIRAWGSPDGGCYRRPSPWEAPP